ncbi:MAG: DUF4345 family protein [Pseudomonadales bacterium]
MAAEPDALAAHLSLFLKAISPLFVVVGALHLALGLGADVMLGAAIPPGVLLDPVLDSQNRFYGVAFSLYGVLLFICAADLEKYQTVLRAVLLVFLAAGAARVVSVAVSGVPALPVVLLLASELLLPPVLLVWLGHALRGGALR